jgi:hypothetical protein
VAISEQDSLDLDRLERFKKFCEMLERLENYPGEFNALKWLGSLTDYAETMCREGVWKA